MIIIGSVAFSQLLAYTGADAVMVGRAAQGRPWLFGQISDHLEGRVVREPDTDVRVEAMLEHVEALHGYYGETMGVRIARKHISWYTKSFEGGDILWSSINREERAAVQKRILNEFLNNQTPMPQAA